MLWLWLTSTKFKIDNCETILWNFQAESSTNALSFQKIFNLISFFLIFLLSFELVSEWYVPLVLKRPEFGKPMDYSIFIFVEPPGRHSFRSNSVASIEVYKGLNNYYRRDAFFSRLANGAFINKEAMAAHCRLSKELELWYKQRESKSNEIDLDEFGPQDATEPYKIEALDHAALRYVSFYSG